MSEQAMMDKMKEAEQKRKDMERLALEEEIIDRHYSRGKSIEMNFPLSDEFQNDEEREEGEEDYDREREMNSKTGGFSDDDEMGLGEEGELSDEEYGERERDGEEEEEEDDDDEDELENNDYGGVDVHSSLSFGGFTAGDNSEED
eukprot:CAMPEP_0182423994 /NCGR_PEP_ID=MMETSP1167-20130531/10111_1 /TAXON_ID=2988 /ORGANISM="Mallomonas Sp, Strain CCMP3275" /LENGTH=144 /DNA_ID=CAMNT_0024603435 /DNA_START=709 /DNA_END=1143 /DNA_ORIENTATION=+